MLHIFKGNMQTWTETIKLADKKKLCNVTKIIRQIKVIRQKIFADVKVMSSHKCVSLGRIYGYGVDK